MKKSFAVLHGEGWAAGQEIPRGEEHAQLPRRFEHEIQGGAVHEIQEEAGHEIQGGEDGPPELEPDLGDVTFLVSGVAQQDSGAGVRGPASLLSPAGAIAQRLPVSLSRRSPAAPQHGLHLGHDMRKAWGTPQGKGSPSADNIAQQLLGQVRETSCLTTYWSESTSSSRCF